MTSRQRNVGGRGKKAESKNVVVSISIPAHIKDLIDLWAVGVIGGRSEIVAQLVEQEEAARRSAPAVAVTRLAPALELPSFNPDWTPRAGDELTAGPTVPSIKSHVATRDRMKQGARLISDGFGWRLDDEPQSRVVVKQMLKSGVLVRKT
jgi:hypothetical protein